MANNVSWERISDFLYLYKEVLEGNNTVKENLVNLSKDLSRIDDDIYMHLEPKMKHYIDIIRLYEFSRIWSNFLKNDYSEAFWLTKMATNVSTMSAPENPTQQELIRMAQAFTFSQKH